MDFERFELSKWLFTTLLGNYQSRLSPTDSAEEAFISQVPLSTDWWWRTPLNIA